ncbi:MAG: hypothetical protein IKT07_12030 [Oscillospiraceae bacterium]|nr:hypothetical protein [Oscillospiraceae bacterium]
MAIQLIGALVLAFLFSAFFGKRFIAWLSWRGISQPLKEEVKDRVYSDKNEDTI